MSRQIRLELLARDLAGALIDVSIKFCCDSVISQLAVFDAASEGPRSWGGRGGQGPPNFCRRCSF